MPRRIPPLSDVQVKNAKPRQSEYRLFDGSGLTLCRLEHGNRPERGTSPASAGIGRLAKLRPTRCGEGAMTRVESLEKEVAGLPPAELAAFRQRVAEVDAASWDRQIEADVGADGLDALADAALTDLRSGRCTEL